MRTLLLLLLLTGPAVAQIGPDLYHAETLVTGREMPGRMDGAAAGLRDVLVKLTGNPALLTDARIANIDPIGLIQDFYYLDRMSDLPHHDEQGTRERPYFLNIAFDPTRIEALLAKLGEERCK